MSFVSPAATGCYGVLYTFRTVPVAQPTSKNRTQDSPAHIGKVYCYREYTYYSRSSQPVRPPTCKWRKNMYQRTSHEARRPETSRLPDLHAWYMWYICMYVYDLPCRSAYARIQLHTRKEGRSSVGVYVRTGLHGNELQQYMSLAHKVCMCV